MFDTGKLYLAESEKRIRGTLWDQGKYKEKKRYYERKEGKNAQGCVGPDQ